MMKAWVEKRVEEFCTNEPHSPTAYSPHSLEACEDLADKKRVCEWVSKDEGNRGQLLEVGEGGGILRPRTREKDVLQC